MEKSLNDPQEILLTAEPTLTFEPFAEELPQVATPPVQENLAKPSFDDSMLSPEEKKMVEDFAAKIDLGNSSVVLQYGAGAQKKIADFSETALGNVRTKDLGELGEMLSGVVSELKSMDAPEEEKGFLGIFKKTSNKITSLKAKYGKAEENITRICTVLEGHQIQLLKDVSMLDKMYQLNTSYFKELSMYILAGKKKLDTVRSTELPALIEKAQKSGLPEDAQAANDLSGLCNRFERKLHDLELTRTVSLQMAPQIRLVQSNDTLMSEKIQSTLVNTIPLWKSQILLALGVNHSQQAAEAQREVTDMTNQLLRQNAQTLKMATVATAKESERGIIDIETLKLTNESLISTLDEVMKIQEDGRARRRSAELELGRIETELKQKLLDIRK
ncbi:MAG: toxic anion resistance protein [Angelakisella sp.]